MYEGRTTKLYKPGDRVVVTSKLTDGMVDAMGIYLGKTLTIKNIVVANCVPTKYEVKEDGKKWAWWDCNFQGLEDDLFPKVDTSRLDALLD